jgi:hypothetical protein
MYVPEVTKRLKENGENIVAFLSNGNGVYSKTAIVDFDENFSQDQQLQFSSRRHFRLRGKLQCFRRFPLGVL